MDEIDGFVKKMEEKYNAKLFEYGTSWKTCEIKYLEEKLLGEVMEYLRSGDKAELVDLANICWMIDVRKGLEENPPRM
jgi:predicted house-cleaning noncanonical NTP pyrophosphatase (MazG superfamily)